jgi:RHS repeat-associated protein
VTHRIPPPRLLLYLFAATLSLGALLHPRPLPAQSCDPTDLTCQSPPDVEITPADGSWTGTAQSMVLAVTVRFCKSGTYPFVAGGESIALDGTAQSFTNSTVVNGCYTSSGNVTLSLGSHTLTASKSGGGGTGTASATWVYALAPPPATYTPLVEPAGGTAYVANGSGGQVQTFTLWNAGTGTATYALTAVCEGSATGCTASASSVTLAPSQSAQVSVTYGATGTTGRVRLNVARSGGSETAGGWIDVQVSTFAVSFPMRNLCVTLALPGDAASECGDLRLAHALPAVRTMSRTRAPVLIYNSGLAEPRARLIYSVTPVATKPPVDSLALVVTLANGRNLGRQSWGGWPAGDWAPGEWRRLVYSADMSDLPTGVYSATGELTAWRSGVSGVLNQSSEFIYVNRSTSRFGAGWWVAGLEAIQPLADGRKLWVGGDGSAQLFNTVNDSTWVAPNPERPDTIRKRTNGSGAIRYVRLLPGGVHVVFGTTGVQDSTVNRLGQLTRFYYGTNGLDSIKTPGAAVYHFDYGTSGGTTKLWQVRLVSGGTTRTVIVGAQDADPRIRTIRDPDNSLVTFDYDATGRRVTRRMDRRGAWTSYGYDASGKVTRGQLELGAAGDVDDVIVRITPGESRGASPTPARFDSVYTLLDGPRPDSDVRDVTRFWIQRGFDNSVPERVVDALGNETLLTYGDTRFRGRVTRVDSPLLPDGTRSSSIATYDARGNLASSVSVNPLRDGRDATTRFERASTAWPDFVTRTTAPMGEVSLAGYDAATGNRLWQQAGTDTTHRVNFAYRAANDATAPNLPASTTYPAGAGQSGRTTETYEYDARGNLSAVQSHLGIRTESKADELGQDTLTRQQITATTWQTTRHVYDAVGQDTLTEVIGPLMNAPDQHLVVRTRHDLEGNVTSVKRVSIPDTTHLDSVVTRFAYDLAGRQVKEIAPDGKRDTTAFDLAGNAIWTLTRRGDTLRTRYDAMNRPLVRYHSAAFYAAERRGIPSVPNFPPTYCPDTTPPYNIYHPYPYYPNVPGSCNYRVPADSSVFEYDRVGRLVRADNADALVRRSYFPGGMLERETQKVQTAARNDTTKHVYVLQYGYDLDGRRISLTHPSRLAPAGGAPTTYGYHAMTGALETVTDPLGNVFRYGYDNAGQLASLQRGSSIFDAYLYDDDGRLRQYNLNVPAAIGGLISQTSLTYDRRGKMLVSRNAVGMQDSLVATYSGLGHLVSSAEEAVGLTQSGYVKVDRSSAQYSYDALGNSYRTISGSGSTTATDSSYGTRGGTNTYQQLTGRLLVSALGSNTDQFAYDSAGNNLFKWGADTQQHYADLASFYGSDGMLRTVDRRSLSGIADKTSVWEEYRYDALGRRVWVRTLNGCSDVYGRCYLNLVRRTVWDGDQALYEIQMQEVEQENDSIPAQTGSLGNDLFDPNPLTGRVLHTYGPGIDQPLSTIRMALVTANETRGFHRWQQFAVFPIWDYQGRAPYVAFSDGTRTHCEGSSQCLNTNWILGWRAYGARSNGTVTSTISTQNSWLGNVLEDHHDASGLLYRRNRYYNPQTGRFTQEDPIGLAGGMNAYGFTDGDPATYSDPFGLKPCRRRAGDICTHMEGYGWTAYFFSIKRGEARYAVHNLRSAWHINVTLRFDARAFGKEMAEKYPELGAVDVEEAARHQLWQCEMTQAYGADIAETVGNAHEEGEESTADSRRDQRNNVIGRASGARRNVACSASVEHNIQSGNFARPPGSSQ